MTILPYNQICRTSCGRGLLTGESLYVWHSHAKKIGNAKKKTAKRGSVWFLSKDWRNIDSMGKLNGSKWLTSLSIA